MSYRNFPNGDGESRTSSKSFSARPKQQHPLAAAQKPRQQKMGPNAAPGREPREQENYTRTRTKGARSRRLLYAPPLTAACTCSSSPLLTRPSLRCLSGALCKPTTGTCGIDMPQASFDSSLYLPLGPPLHPTLRYRCLGPMAGAPLLSVNPQPNCTCQEDLMCDVDPHNYLLGPRCENNVCGLCVIPDLQHQQHRARHPP